MPADARRKLLEASRLAPLHPGEIICQPDQVVADVWFPVSGLISFVVELETGFGVESATAGTEGAAGVEAAFAGGRAPLLTMSQVKGEALTVPARVFRDVLASWDEVRQLIARYVVFLMQTAAQSAACNRYHEVDERLARWLLVTQDSVGDRFELTQEFTAQMLGTHRPSVTISARRLSTAGLISYRRGDIQVLDRIGLEEASCECYGAMRERVDRIYTGEDAG